MLFITLWITGAIISWIGTLLYGKHIRGFSWEETFRFVNQTKGTFAQEVMKVLLYIVAWPIEIAGVIYQWESMKLMTRRIIKNFSQLDKWES